MQCLLMAGMLLTQAPQAQDRSRQFANDNARQITSPLTDGQWTVVCAEKDGQPAEDARGKSATVQSGVVTWTHDGKQCSARLHFLPHNRVFATDFVTDGQAAVAASDRGTAEAQEPNKAEGRSHMPNAGVYIATKDMVCLCFHTGTNQANAGNKAQNELAAGGISADQNKLVLILKKGS